ncbi:MAG: hypothetical protein ACO3R5_07815 [Pseudohongiellaceae bacterium]
MRWPLTLRSLHAITLPALLSLGVTAAESPDPFASGSTLSAEEPGADSGYSGAKILLVPGHDGTMFALRAGINGELRYRFSLGPSISSACSAPCHKPCTVSWIQAR